MVYELMVYGTGAEGHAPTFESGGGDIVGLPTPTFQSRIVLSRYIVEFQKKATPLFLLSS